MNSEVLELDNRFGAEFAGKYIFKEITWAKRNRIIQKHTKYNNVTGEIVSSDFIAIQAETIMAALHGQPDNHQITLEKLLSEDSEKGLPFELGELLAQHANRVCSLTKEETRFLSNVSDEKNLTAPSPVLDSQKNSDGLQTKSPNNQPESFTNTQSSSTS
jgi:hypothetical protein